MPHQIPNLYETENIPAEEKIIYQHWHIPAINFHWFIAELDPVRRIAFGYAYLNDPINAEWGYISIDELEENGVMLDREWVPRRFKEIKRM